MYLKCELHVQLSVLKQMYITCHISIACSMFQYLVVELLWALSCWLVNTSDDGSALKHLGASGSELKMAYLCGYLKAVETIGNYSK